MTGGAAAVTTSAPMPPRDLQPVTPEERRELRRMYLAARGGTWEAVNVATSGQIHLYAVEQGADGSEHRWLLALPGREADGQLMAAARNVLPRLFAQIDAAERRAEARGLPIVGSIS